MKSLTFVTGNHNKFMWTKRYLSIPLVQKKLDLTEIQSLSPTEVIQAKLTEAYKQLKTPVLVEDTSLTFHALGKLPGPFIKWFLAELGSAGLCQLLDKDRSATATVVYGLFDGKHARFYEASIAGTITKTPRGTAGFGWDSIFVPDGQKKTHAEMTDDELDMVNMRRVALEKLQKDFPKDTKNAS